jgi:hypothetical protein
MSVDEGAQAGLAFEHAGEEIRFFKEQQWRITNYALLLQTAMVGAMGLVEESFKPVWAIVGRVGCVVIAVCAIGLLISYQAGIWKESAKMAAARTHLHLLDKLHREQLFWPYRVLPGMVLTGANLIACLAALLLLPHLK